MGWLARLISRTAEHPAGVFGRLLGWIWWRETAPVNDHALHQGDGTDLPLREQVGLDRLSGLHAAGFDELDVVRSPDLADEAVWVFATRAAQAMT